MCRHLGIPLGNGSLVLCEEGVDVQRRLMGGLIEGRRKASATPSPRVIPSTKSSCATVHSPFVLDLAYGSLMMLSKLVSRRIPAFVNMNDSIGGAGSAPPAYTRSLVEMPELIGVQAHCLFVICAERNQLSDVCVPKNSIRPRRSSGRRKLAS